MSTTRRLTAGTLVAVALSVPPATRSIDAAPAASSCESLASLGLPGAQITLAQSVAAGALSLPGNGGAAFKQLGALCRVAATLKPSSDSDIKIEVWMPAANWNGKFQAVGNGAFSGTIAYPAMATALGRGYATSSTDTGHVGNSGDFALGHPEKVIDFGWRAVHEMTVASKDHRRLLRCRPEVFVLERLFRRRTPGDERSAALPRGFRRHHRRGAWSRLDRPRGAGRARRPGAAEGRGGASVAGQGATAAHGGARSLRREGWREGRRGRRSEAVHVRSGRAAVQGRRERIVPHVGRARHRQIAVLASGESQDKTRNLGPPAGQRAGMDRPGMDRVGSSDRARSVPVPRVQGSAVGHRPIQGRQ